MFSASVAAESKEEVNLTALRISLIFRRLATSTSHRSRHLEDCHEYSIWYWRSPVCGLFLLMIGLTLFSVSKMNDVDHDLIQINEVNSVKQRFAINFRGSVHDRSIAIRDVVLREDPAERQAAIDLIAKLAATYAENEQKMNAMISAPGAATEPEKAIVAEIADIQAKTNPVVADIIARQMANDGVQTKKILLDQAAPLFVSWLKAIRRAPAISKHAATKSATWRRLSVPCEMR